jgi:hypothetical protein
MRTSRSGGIAPPFYTSHNVEVSGQLHVPAALHLGKRTHWIGGWVSPRLSLDSIEQKNILQPLGFEPRLSSL